MNSDCIFCKIINGSIKASLVYEDEKILALLDVKPSSPGHTMIIPKKHGATILDYSPEELGALMGAAQIVTRKIERALKTDSVTMGINHKEETGVRHLHFHLIPRWKNDKGFALQSVVKNPQTEDVSITAQKIREA